MQKRQRQIGDMKKKPFVIDGGRHADARGVLRFCNDFDMSVVKRFYTIANSAEQPVRGWIGHKKETKRFFPLRGTTTIEVEPMNLAAESSEGTREMFVLEEGMPSVLEVPPGNWFCIKQDGNAEVMIFSDCKVCEYKNDDYRRPL